MKTFILGLISFISSCSMTKQETEVSYLGCYESNSKIKTHLELKASSFNLSQEMFSMTIDIKDSAETTEINPTTTIINKQDLSCTYDLLRNEMIDSKCEETKTTIFNLNGDLDTNISESSVNVRLIVDIPDAVKSIHLDSSSGNKILDQELILLEKVECKEI